MFYLGGHLRFESHCIRVNMVLWVSSGNWRLGKYFKEYRQDGVGICLVRVYDSAVTVCAKAFSTYIRVTVSAPNILGGDVFGAGIFHWYLVPWNRTSLISCSSLFLCLPPLPYPACFKIHELDCSGDGGGSVIIRYVLSSNEHTQSKYCTSVKLLVFHWPVNMFCTSVQHFLRHLWRFTEGTALSLCCSQIPGLSRNHTKEIQ